jgi:hypothetical protein
MPAWLEILIDLSGFAGFVVLAVRGGAFRQTPADDRTDRHILRDR